MKKLFVAILALGALASCQKENLPVVEEAKNKTIEINILNITEDTRSLTDPTVGGDTAQGTEALCADFKELKVLFARTNGTIEFEFPLYATDGVGDDHKNGENVSNENNLGGDWTNGGSIVTDDGFNAQKGTRRWHNVPSYITRIAVVRYEAKDLTITPGTTKLADVEALATNQALNIELPVTKMALYGEDTLVDTGETHRVDDVVYHVWKADVNVAPAFARFEVRSIKCTDLGDDNHDYVVDSEGNKVLTDGNPTLNLTTYGFDELLLKSLTLTYGGDDYTAPDFGTQRLYGSYVPAADYTYLYDTNTYEGTANRSAENTTANEYTPKTENGAWSWNLAPGTFEALVLNIDAYAYDYDIDLGGSRNFPLTVTGLSKTAGGNTNDGSVFEAGNIYYIDLVFTESNIMDDEGICVDVVVTVNAWKVAQRYPIYGK